MRVFTLFSLLVFYLQSFSQIAVTPPMGWNSYNCFGSTVREEEVKENADYMAANLKQYGWQYIVVDYHWCYPNPPASTVGNVMQFRLEDGAYVPWLAMDENGRVLPDLQKFPAAQNSKGFKSLAGYIHSLGLKFGIHVMRGVPRQAVCAKSKIAGIDGVNASMIVDTNSTCSWSNLMWGVDMTKRGAQEYYNSLADLYASWEVDYIKMDNMNTALDSTSQYYKTEVEAMRKAIDQSGRKMLLSLSPGQQYQSKEHLIVNANLFRISSDFWDEWSQLKEQFSLCSKWSKVSEPGHWPDADMLQLGKISKRGPEGIERYSHFNEEEQRTHFTLWSIFRSPLMMGGYMPENTSLVKELMTNEEVIAVNQNGIESGELYRKDDIIVWASRMPESKTYNVAFFNLRDTVAEIQVDFSQLNLKGKCDVRDLWKKKDVGIFKKSYKQIIPPHGAAMFRISTSK